MREVLCAAAIVACAGFLYVGCDDDNDGGPSGPTADADIAGTWTGPFAIGADTLTVAATFVADSTYQLSAGVDPLVIYTEWGTYTVSGNTATITSDTCSIQHGLCGTPQTATVSGTSMAYSYLGQPIALTKEP